MGLVRCQSLGQSYEPHFHVLRSTTFRVCQSSRNGISDTPLPRLSHLCSSCPSCQDCLNTRNIRRLVVQCSRESRYLSRELSSGGCKCSFRWHAPPRRSRGE